LENFGGFGRGKDAHFDQNDLGSGLPVSPNRCQSAPSGNIQKMMVEATVVAGVHSESNLLFAVMGDLTMATQNGLPIRTLKKLMFFCR
jgi:hypothetical protein